MLIDKYSQYFSLDNREKGILFYPKRFSESIGSELMPIIFPYVEKPKWKEVEPIDQQKTAVLIMKA
jgi:hypothetical protein